MFKAVVIGVSAGGLNALKELLLLLPGNFNMAVIIVQHRLNSDSTFLSDYYNDISELKVKEAELREKIEAGIVYFAPAGYHLYVEKDRTFGLSLDPLVNYSIPSIDVLFTSAAEVYRDELIGIVLTGANRDGAEGLFDIKEQGGLTIVQDPATAYAADMPEAAIKRANPPHIESMPKIAAILKGIRDE